MEGVIFRQLAHLLICVIVRDLLGDLVSRKNGVRSSSEAGHVDQGMNSFARDYVDHGRISERIGIWKGRMNEVE